MTETLHTHSPESVRAIQLQLALYAYVIRAGGDLVMTPRDLGALPVGVLITDTPVNGGLILRYLPHTDPLVTAYLKTLGASEERLALDDEAEVTLAILAHREGKTGLAFNQRLIDLAVERYNDPHYTVLRFDHGDGIIWRLMRWRAINKAATRGDA